MYKYIKVTTDDEMYKHIKNLYVGCKSVAPDTDFIPPL